MTASPGTLSRIKLTRASVDRATCPPGKSQTLYRDTEQRGLALRVTASGAKSFVFESKLGGKTIRMTIGPASMPIRSPRDSAGRPTAQGADAEAIRLADLIRQGIDPRADKALQIARQQEERAAAKASRLRHTLTGLDAWAVYVEERREQWSKRNHADHLRMVAAGGQARKRSREKVTVPGPLRSLLAHPLAEIDASAVEEWVSREARTRPARAALGFRLLRAFVNWCAEHPDYRTIVQTDACRGRRTREKLPKPAARDDALQREQLAAWFAEVRKLSPVQAAYLQALLLTGARREELAGLRWEDVDFRWGSLRIRDKVEGERTVPLTPYVASLLRDLQARNAMPPAVPRRLRADPDTEAARREWKPSPWVFASRAAKGGRIQEPRAAHVRALTAAGLPHLTLHGLRRSFGTLAEWVECPVGIVAQIQGHKPSAIAEKHYRVRPLDLLRLWHERIEAWILAEAGIDPPANARAPEPAALRVVGGMDAG